MPYSSLFRTNAILWLSPLVLVVASLFAYETVIREQEAYTLSITARGAYSIFIIAPVCAACAAWEGGRLKRAGWVNLPHARSIIGIATAALIPIFVVGIVLVSVIVMGSLIFKGLLVPDWRIMLIAVALIISHTFFGFAIGLKIPPLVSVPSVLLLDYIWMVFPPALDPMWVRNLTGAWDSCCNISADFAIGAFLGSLAVAAGILITALLLIQDRTRLRYTFVALLPLICAVVLGRYFAINVPSSPHAPRDQAELICSDSSAGEQQVCMWPEQLSRLDEVASIVADASKKWRDYGIEVPLVIKSGSYAPTAGQRDFRMRMKTSPESILYALSYSLLPPLPICDGGLHVESSIAGQKVGAWLSVIAGLPLKEMKDRLRGADEIGEVSKVLELPQQEQLDWFERNSAAAVKTCEAIEN